jgi:hypothetical protein
MVRCLVKQRENFTVTLAAFKAHALYCRPIKGVRNYKEMSKKLENLRNYSNDEGHLVLVTKPNMS